MLDTCEIKTAAIRLCEGCAIGILDRDRFCRWCGARQSPAESKNHALCVCASTSTSASNSCVVLTTTKLSRLTADDDLHQVSGPLLSAVVASVASDSVAQARPSLVKSAVIALLSIPIWMIIVLLSPLDAYAAVRNLARQA